MEKKIYKNSTLERRVQAYLKPREYMMFMAEKDCLIRNESEHAQFIINKYYSSLPDSQQRHLLDIYDKKVKELKANKKSENDGC
jgi:hypothetical protein